MTFRVEGLEALVWFATAHLVVTAAFATHLLGMMPPSSGPGSHIG